MTTRIMYRTSACDDIQALPVLRATENRITYTITDDSGQARNNSIDNILKRVITCKASNKTT
jgi:hypothetical protein